MNKLTPEERAIFIVGYFTGTIDRDIEDGVNQDVATTAGNKAMSYILDEFGYKLPDQEKVVDFIKELNVVTEYLTKEWKLER